MEAAAVPLVWGPLDGAEAELALGQPAPDPLPQETLEGRWAVYRLMVDRCGARAYRFDGWWPDKKEGDGA